MFETRIYFSYNHEIEYENVIRFLNLNIKGYTIFEGLGIWNGINEKSKVIEIIHDSVELTTLNIKTIAKRIKRIAKQENVLITKKIITSEFV